MRIAKQAMETGLPAWSGNSNLCIHLAGRRGFDFSRSVPGLLRRLASFPQGWYRHLKSPFHVVDGQLNVGR